MAENKSAFPTEELSLPSKGLLYPEDSPLSSGTIEVKYMTAKEEDILTSTNLIEKGLVIDRLLESVIANPKIQKGRDHIPKIMGKYKLKAITGVKLGG